MTPIALTAMAWNGGLALTLWSGVFAAAGLHLDDDRRRGGAGWIAGVLAGLALTFRPDLVIAVGLVFGWLLWRHPAARRPVLLGAVVGSVPMWVHLVMAGPVSRVRGHGRRPGVPAAGRPGAAPPAVVEPPRRGAAGGRRGDPAVVAAPPSRRRTRAVPVVLRDGARHRPLLAFAICGGAGRGFSRTLDRAARRRAGQRRHPPPGAAAAGLRPPQLGHVRLVAVRRRRRRWRCWWRWRPSIAAGRRHRRSVRARPDVHVHALFTFRYYLLHTRVGLGQVPSPFRCRARRPLLLPRRPTRRLPRRAGRRRRARALAEPGERLLVGPLDLRRTWYSDVFIYWLFPELEPATYYIEMDPGLANAEGSSLADDVASADWVILTGLWDGWMEPNSSMDYGSDAPNQVMRDQFCVVGTWEDSRATTADADPHLLSAPE